MFITYYYYVIMLWYTIIYSIMSRRLAPPQAIGVSSFEEFLKAAVITPNRPTNITPTNMARVKLFGKSPMDMRVPPLRLRLCWSQAL